MIIAKLLDPKNEYVYKRIFGHTGNEEKYSKLVLTNDLELYIISLEKAKNSTKNKKEELYNWLKFINNPKEVTRNGR